MGKAADSFVFTEFHKRVHYELWEQCKSQLCFTEKQVPTRDWDLHSFLVFRFLSFTFQKTGESYSALAMESEEVLLCVQ